uniref:Uncharacterized protein n=1 Tax=Anser brachyrhynchus TaxID=132585 RepID=A0A8B9CB76_9AVES
RELLGSQSLWPVLMASFLQAAGFDERMISYMTLSVGLSELLAAVVCSTLIERFGRKVLLCGGYTLMCSVLALLTMTLSLQVTRQQPSGCLPSTSPLPGPHQFFWLHYFSVILIFLFVFFYGIGPCEYKRKFLYRVGWQHNWQRRNQAVP